MEAEANGIKIGYDVSGDGPWLALCHPLGLDRTMWSRQMAALSRVRRVLAWDARGHGQSTKAPGPYDFDLMAADLAALFDVLGIERAAVLGLSMGGDIAMAFAATYPDRTSALILADTTAWYGPNAASNWDDRIAAVRRDGVASLAPIQAERWFSGSFRTSNPEVVERILGLLRSADAGGYIATMQALSRLDLRARLESISCPTLIVVGSDDPATPPAMAEQLHQGIAGSELVVLEGAKHLSPVEQADAFNQKLLEFLARADP